jgi:hypothetical protein
VRHSVPEEARIGSAPSHCSWFGQVRLGRNSALAERLYRRDKDSLCMASISLMMEISLAVSFESRTVNSSKVVQLLSTIRRLEEVRRRFRKPLDRVQMVNFCELL